MLDQSNNLNYPQKHNTAAVNTLLTLGLIGGTWLCPTLLAQEPTEMIAIDQDNSSSQEIHKENTAPQLEKKSPPPIAQRKVVQPPSEYYYISAKKLELKGEEAVKDAMAIYRMALHNGANDRAREEAYLGLARCEYRLGNYWRAYKAVESSFPDDFNNQQTQLRTRMEMDLAGLLVQSGNKPVKDAQDENGKELNGYQTAAVIYNSVTYNDPKGDLAREALRRRGQCLMKTGDLVEAEKAYYTLKNTYPNSPEALEAGPELVELLALKSQNEGGLRGKKYDEAVNILRQGKTAPIGGAAFQQKIEKAQQAVDENAAETRLKEALYYRKRGGDKARQSAKFLLADIIKRYPQTAAGRKAQEIFDKDYGKNGGR